MVRNLVDHLYADQLLPLVISRSGTMKLIHTLLASLAFAFTLSVHANNIQVSNPFLFDNGNSAQVVFDLSWENSWRTSVAPNNWDAAWVFVRYWNTAGVCNHAYLGNQFHVAPAGSQIEIGLYDPGSPYNAGSNPVVGAFIHRDADGAGTLNLSQVQLHWNYGAIGLTINDIVLVQVYAIEMVYVPQGSFYVGSGGNEIGSFTDGAWTSGSPIPYQITSENAITIGQSAGNLWGIINDSGPSTIGGAGTLPAAFPKGFKAFYSMKYEISQQQYVDFLNSLNYDQQAWLTNNSPNSAAGTGALVNAYAGRNGIVIKTSGVASSVPAVYGCNLDQDATIDGPTDGQWVPCFLERDQLYSFLDWSGLRPMSELEYEKACRGPGYPVVNDHPWGIDLGWAPSANFVNAGAANESYSEISSPFPGYGRANLSMSGINAPLRVGVFAAHPTNTGRISSGASYYGIMELAGNMEERAISVAGGRSFTGNHGNCILQSWGATDEGWTLYGIGSRGGNWWTPMWAGKVSSRYRASSFGEACCYSHGGRGVRTAQ
jgi:hypothetical protein